MGNPVVHFEVIGRDPQALRTFYQRAFDWEFGPPMAQANYAMAHPGADGSAGRAIDGGIGGAIDDYDGHVTFYVEVPDLDAALSKIHGLGGKTMMPPDTVPGGPRIALFTDPEGHVIGLVQAPTPG
jgi:uncharacterized protein